MFSHFNSKHFQNDGVLFVPRNVKHKNLFSQNDLEYKFRNFVLKKIQLVLVFAN